jgi:hypothetical protein
VANKTISQKVIFFVIGDGEMIIELKKFVSYSISKIEVQFVGELDNSLIPNFLIGNKIDINFAMGTSILDSMQCGVPSILLNYSYNDISLHPSYYFADEELNYSLGRELNSSDLLKSNSVTLGNCINNYLLDSNKYRINAYNYASKFSVDIVANKFLNKVNDSKLYYTDVKNYFKRSITRKVYNKLKYKLI